MLITLLALLVLLAFANGANDNCKGVATLVGYGAANPKQALLWAAFTTACGSMLSFWMAAGLIKNFSTGLFVSGTPLTTAFFIAVLSGAFGWVILSTITGLPVSTTHAITGALTGAGLLAFGNAQFQWSFLGARFALPLAISPLLSLGAVYLIAWPVGYIVMRVANRCVCIVETHLVAAAVEGASVTSALAVDEEANCVDAAGVKASAVANGIHWLSSGMVGFARGWNDAPKIAALAMATLAATNVGHGGAIAFGMVSVAMAAGGLLAGRKVLQTLSKKVTTMPLAESLTASCVTATLVSLASWNGLPVSTTHVSTGAIIGVGLKHDPRAVHWAKVSEIVLSWVVTLPAAGLLAAMVARIIH